MPNTNRDLINSAMGASQDPNQDDYQSAMGAGQFSVNQTQFFGSTASTWGSNSPTFGATS